MRKLPLSCARAPSDQTNHTKACHVQGGKGLQGTLAQHSRKFYGVLNGIDDEAWNPATDSLLNHQYSADDLSGKEANKRMLRERLGLTTQGDDARRPLVSSCHI
jgi:glycogen synthase